MPFADLPQTFPFIIFLLLFIVFIIYPAWKKTSARIRKALKDIEAGEATPGFKLQGQAAKSTGQATTLELTDFENFVLWQLAQTESQYLTRKQLIARLHLEPKDLKTALRSLADKGMIYMEVSSWFKIRYLLSESGYQYATGRGFITNLHNIRNY